MYFMHDKCGSFAYVDLTSLVNITAIPFIDQKGGLSANNISIIKSKPSIGKDNIHFICENCKDSFPSEHIIGVCGYCRKQFPADELNSVKECGDLVCNECSTLEYFDEDAVIIPLSKSFESLSIGD